MTIQDLINDSIELQGRLKVVSFAKDEEKIEFSGTGDELGYTGFTDKPWFCDMQISYIHPIEGEEGFVIEVVEND